MTLELPLFPTRVPGLTQEFDLTSKDGRQDYFKAKVGAEANRLRAYLEDWPLTGFFLGPKGSGKGTLVNQVNEALGQGHLFSISVGDVVRRVDQEISDPQKLQELKVYLQGDLRGPDRVREVIAEGWVQNHQDRNTQTLLPTAYALSLARREINKHPRRALLVDGFPRGDQLPLALCFKHQIGRANDPDFFTMIHVSESVLDTRMKDRVVCPKCQLPRGLALFPTKEIGYDQETGEFFLKCDNPPCDGQRLVSKEGDKNGIDRGRLDDDRRLMEDATRLPGIHKIYLRNSVPVSQKKDFDPYELTPRYGYSWDPGTQRVRIFEEPWITQDDNGVPSYSLQAPAVAVSFVKQLVEVLGI